MNPAIATRPHLVYRCYDADDQLIYIGCTSTSMEVRLRRHKSTHPAVYEQTAHWTTEPYPDRETALDAEANAIYRERPPLNYRFNPARNPRAGMTRVEPTEEEMRAAINRLSLVFTPNDGGAA